MASDDHKTLEPSSPSPSGDWKEHIGIPTLLAGAVGAGVGLLSKHSKVHGVAQMSASYAANFAIVTGCYCGLAKTHGLVLGGMRHPNMVLLVGACPEYGCLVYEYMENGSLEDRLFRKDNSPPIPWKTRFKIAAEISTALLFLHQTKPEPLVHRDLKPANILLNSNYVSKISDVGLARLVPASTADSVTQYHMTAAAGTFCYIDPEYQQTGMLGVKSDVYSLGVMLLQIITAKPPMGLTHQVERAIESGKFAEILDPAVMDWPIQEALSYAKLALQCCELRKKDRPDLGSVVVQEMNRLRDFGLSTTDVYYGISNDGGNSFSRSDANQEAMRNTANVGNANST